MRSSECSFDYASESVSSESSAKSSISFKSDLVIIMYIMLLSLLYIFINKKNFSLFFKFTSNYKTKVVSPKQIDFDLENFYKSKSNNLNTFF